MVSDNRKTGDRGEDAAVRFLKNQGYDVIERNFTTMIGEIDIICLKPEHIIFVEVKVENPYYPAIERAGFTKFEKIKKNALLYLKMYRQYDKLNIRFDLIIVDKYTSECDHFPGVYFD